MPPKKNKTEIKKLYLYKGKNAKGQEIQGQVQADKSKLAKAILKRQGISHITLSEKKPSFLKTKKNPIKSSEVATFTRQMATMSKAGIPLVQGLGVIIDGSDDPKFKELVTAIKDEVESGRSLSQALKQYPMIFDDLFCNLIQAGEKSGSLDTMLDRIATYKEKTESLKRKIKKAMYYPSTVIVVALIVTIVLLIKVVPTFKELFSGFGAELPGFTLLVLSISEAIQEHGIKIFSIFTVIIFLLIRSYKKSSSFRHKIERLTLKMPVFGNIIHKAIIARFARTLATTFAAGVPLTDSLMSVARASGNIVYHKALLKIKDDVSSGEHLRRAMEKVGIFPNMIIQMIGIGEESGSLESMLLKISVIYEEEVDTAVDGLATLLEPFIMVFLGIVVGGLVVAMYLPIFKLGSVI